MADEDWNNKDKEDEVNRPGGYVDQAQSVVESHLDENSEDSGSDVSDLGDAFGY